MKRTLTMSSNRHRSPRLAIVWATVCVLAAAPASVGVGQARAAVVAPGVTTGAAQQVQFASATVTGTVNPEGTATTYYFQYGPTAAYGMQTSAASAGSATVAAPVSQTLTGLTASTTYHYRLVGMSAGGTVDGTDAVFATSRTPAPTANTGVASSVTPTTAVLNGTVNPEGMATTYYFQYGPTAAYGMQTSAASAGSATVAAPVSQSLTGLRASTTYHFRVVAVSAGRTVDGRDARFATVRTPAPTAITGGVSALSTTGAVVSGTVNPEGVTTSYYFAYGTKSPLTRSPTASAGSGTANVAASAPLLGLVPGTSYVYRLVAVGASTTTGVTRSFTTPRIPVALSLSAAANPVRAGAGATFHGALSGTGAGVRAVALETDRYPYTAGFQRAGNAELTSATGTFSVTLPRLTANTIVRAVTVGGSPSVASAPILERVIVRVTVHVRRRGRAARFSGLVFPSGVPVAIRIQRRIRGRWMTIARTPTHLTAGGQTAYGRTIGRPHRGRYRIVAHVRDGSLLSSTSRVVSVN